jgi:hypothetical protein
MDQTGSRAELPQMQIAGNNKEIGLFSVTSIFCAVFAA